MRIHRFQHDASHLERERADLLLLARAPSARSARPCAACDEPCSCARRSRSCACGCRAECPNAPRALSSDGDAHPIERGVLPVVFGLAEMRVVQPCWSCEGHRSEIGADRAPQVWFHSPSAVYAALISEHIARLAHLRRISTPWSVAICDHQNSIGGTVFVLRPSLAGEMHLGRLRADLQEIGRTLFDGVQQLAAGRLETLEREAKRATS